MSESSTHPYLVREVRLIAITRALNAVATFRLDDSVARATAYRSAGVAPVTPDEDREALRRQHLYFRAMRPALAASLRAFATERALVRTESLA